MQKDIELTMKDHIKAVCKSAYTQLRNIALIRRYVTQEAAATRIQSLVNSRLDSLNSLLYGMPDSELFKMQRIQNYAAKVVLRKKKSDHVTSLLKSLHWLKIPYRIEYTTSPCLPSLTTRYIP